MRQTVLTLAVRLVAVLAGLVSSIVTARLLGPEGRGVFFFWSTVAALTVQFGNFGLHASNIYLHARQHVDAAVLSANSLLAALVAGVVLTIGALAAMALKGHADALHPMVIAAILMLTASGLYSLLGSNLLVAMGRLTEFNLLELFNKLLLLAVLVAVVALWQDPLVLLLAIGAASTLAAGVVMWRLSRHAPPTSPNWRVFRSGISYGMRAYLAACLATVVARLNAFLLEPAIPAADYGAWSIASQICDMMSIFPTSIALVLLPRVMRSENPRSMVRANALATAGIMLVLVLAFAAVGRPLIVLIYGADFSSAFDYVLWGAPGVLALAVITILSQYLASVGIPRLLIVLWGALSALHLGMATVLIPSHGAVGAMASQSITYLIGLVLIYALIRHLRDRHA